MQLRNTLRELYSGEDRAVSPVIGVILMVAITVILAAVIASFVLGLGPSEAAPSAQFEFEENTSSNNNLAVEIAHQSGDKIDASTLYTRGSLINSSSEIPWSNSTGSPGAFWDKSFSGSEIGSGDSITVNVSDSWELSVVWEKGDQSSELASQSS
ncbi:MULTISPECIES: type IV pilin N-terminal domain-containing protein [Salinibaculum]|uniref:type IV pilin N-terminal domain-containing protein n=1 Tax=Salinibaculum TaxID=2732368 RepID=UPI0030D462EF